MTTRLLFTVEPGDVGRSEVIRNKPDCPHCGASGKRTYSVSGVCGKLQRQDIGKRVYLVGDVMQMENLQQLCERKVKAAAKRGAR